MIQKKKSRTAIAFVVLFAFLWSGCKNGTTTDSDNVVLAYTGSQFFEYYDVGNDRNADSLNGRGSEVCIATTEYNENTISGQEYAYGLYRLSDYEILEQSGITDKIYPASTTKLLTALLALKYCDLNEQVTFSYNATHLGVYGAVSCDFKEGDTVVLEDLLAALLIYSGNDVGVAIAEHISGSVEAFAELMNEEAKRLGAVDTHFVNPHGLHNREHYTTAYDIYLILNELIHYKQFVSIVSMSSCEIDYIDVNGNAKTKVFNSTNLYFEGSFEAPEEIEIIGGKTGTTNAAGCCLILFFKDKEGVSYIAEVFHAPSYEVLYGKMTELMKVAASK